MPAGKRSIHSGGYNPGAAARLKAVTLPDKIKCTQCRRHFMHTKFSQKQLNDFRQRLFFNPETGELPKCRQCVGGPPTELTCHRCELTKDLGSFTKVQRRKPDTAFCKDCQQEVDDVEPNIEDALQEQEILDAQTNIGTHSVYNYDSLRGSLPAWNSHSGESESRNRINTSAISSENLLHFNQSRVAGQSHDGVWTGQSPVDLRAKDKSAVAALDSPSTPSLSDTITAWDEIGSQAGSEHAYSGRIALRDGQMAHLSDRQSGNWAREGAVKPDRGALRQAEKQREAQRKVQEQERAQFEEEESSGSEWEL